MGVWKQRMGRKSRVASKGIPVRPILNQQKVRRENRMHFRVPEEKKHWRLLHPQSKTRTLPVTRPALWEMLKGGLVLEAHGRKHTEVQHASRTHVWRRKGRQSIPMYKKPTEPRGWGATGEGANKDYAKQPRQTDCLAHLKDRPAERLKNKNKTAPKQEQPRAGEKDTCLGATHCSLSGTHGPEGNG